MDHLHNRDIIPPERHRTYRLIQQVIPEPLLRTASRLLPESIKRTVNHMINSYLFKPIEQLLAHNSEAKQKESGLHVSKEQLVADIEACQFPAGCIVFVHSSLKALGYVEGGTRTVVETLRTAIVARLGGTLAMPALSLTGTMYDTLRSGQVFSVKTSPSMVGAITEEFRTFPEVLRSIHPTHSVVALGRQAAWLVEAHASCGSTFGEGSPLAKLLEAESYLFGLGVDLGPVTFYHVLEDRHLDFPFRVYTTDSPFEAVCYDEHGYERRLKVMAHDPEVAQTRIDRPSGTWIREYMTRYLEQRGSLRWVKIGAGRAWIIRAQDMYEGLEELLAKGITIYSTQDQVERMEIAH